MKRLAIIKRSANNWRSVDSFRNKIIYLLKKKNNIFHCRRAKSIHWTAQSFVSTWCGGRYIICNNYRSGTNITARAVLIIRRWREVRPPHYIVRIFYLEHSFRRRLFRNDRRRRRRVQLTVLIAYHNITAFFLFFFFLPQTGLFIHSLTNWFRSSIVSPRPLRAAFAILTHTRLVFVGTSGACTRNDRSRANWTLDGKRFQAPVITDWNPASL